MEIYEKASNIQTRWSSFENPQAKRGQAALENKGAKGHAFERFAPGETKTLLDITGSGLIHRIWLTINDRSPEMLRSLRLDMFWDDASRPAVSVPLGDFFGIALGKRSRFECALFADPEGRSFLSFLQMPFRKSARITITNESVNALAHLFYDINLSLRIEHSPETLYLHALWRRESPNELGRDFHILPHLQGAGRFLGCNLGVLTNPVYEGAWWGEGEVKVWFGDDTHPTLCGTGTEDYIGTAWGQGSFSNQYQGCPIADTEKGQWAFYRYHLEDPIYFYDGCRVAIQTIGGCTKEKAMALQKKGAPLIPVSLDQGDNGPLRHLMNEKIELRSISQDGWCNFWRKDDWSATAYVYHESPEGQFPELPDVSTRTADLDLEDPPSKPEDA